ncbi:peptidase inhibitor family I36 protein [Sphaerisporangium sp. NPDC051017]|uniref:peptidase inhibitor family I36 protein n=1 Tax=unclassified Sphaerisporangium TaxID=2630420 RepID=UPI0033DF240A
MKAHLAALALATTALLPAGVGAAHADDALSGPPLITIPAGQTRCPDGYVCLFRDNEFQGGGYGIASGHSVGFLGDIGFNDQMSSWANDSGRRYCWYVDANYAGDRHVMENRYRVNVLPQENDQASSLRPC